jgi:uncharacterized linocin/CFP29 family protein
MMDPLRRSAAPLSERAWRSLDEAVTKSARHALTGRRLATFDGPKGWDHVGSRLATARRCPTEHLQAAVCVPDVAVLAEIAVEFSLPWASLDAFERGAPELDTGPAEVAAREVALAEDSIVLYGEPVGWGFLASKDSPRIEPRESWTKPGQIVADLVAAVEALDAAGIGGPYEAVLAPAGYYTYVQAMAQGGYPAARQLEALLANVHRSLVLRERGAVFSTRGGDFVITVGGDLAVGYRYHDDAAIHLVCLETVGAQTLTPQAVCTLAD